MSDKIFAEMESNIDLIQRGRKELADLKKEKIQTKSMSWADAVGTAKEKEDFVRATVADLDKQIGYKEANIEYCYNKNKILEKKLEYLNE